jgi:hypothetical protein
MKNNQKTGSKNSSSKKKHKSGLNMKGFDEYSRTNRNGLGGYSIECY